MTYRNDDNCDKCKNCINTPGKDYCNTTCENKDKNCYESYKVFTPNIYGKAYVNLQPYDNLFTINDSFAAGTIFKDLYSPYCDVKKYVGGFDKE